MDTYSVLIEVRAQAAPGLDVDSALGALLDRLDLGGYGPSVSGSPDGWSARIFVPGADAVAVVADAALVVTRAAREVGLPTWPIAATEAARLDVFDEQLARPQMPDLVSGPEAAEIAGVSLQRWHQLVAAHPDRLRPAIERPGAMLWFRAGVEAFATEQRKPGRRPGSAA